MSLKDTQKLCVNTAAIEFTLESLKKFQSNEKKWDYSLKDFDHQPRITKESQGLSAVFFPYKT